MIILDSLLAGGISFVLDKLAAAVDSEMSGEKAEANLRERLLAAEMELELGEIDEDEFAVLEREILSHLRELRQGERADQGALSFAGGGLDVEVSFDSPAPVAGAKGGAKGVDAAPPGAQRGREDTAAGTGQDATAPGRRTRRAKAARAPRKRPASPAEARS